MKYQKHELKHFEKIRGMASECTLFLKMDGSFPLTAPCKIYAIGGGVRYTIKGGTGGGEVNSHFYTTIEQGLTNAGFSITSDAWLHAYDEIKRLQNEEHDAKIRENLKKGGMRVFGLFVETGKHDSEPEFDLPLDMTGDAAVYVLSRNSGEGYDRTTEKGDFALTDNEIRDIRALSEHFSKFMLVLNVGGAVDLSPVINFVPNILVLSQLGVVTGDILPDILLGKSNPSGKLTTTWASINDYPTTEGFGDPDETDYKEGIYVGYRYFETVGKKPLFPFGYGLSYTDFSIIPDSFTADGSTVSVQAGVENIGAYEGKETIQLYVTKPEGKLQQPLLELVAFKKTPLISKGNEKSVTLSVHMDDLASYDEETASYILEKGDYVFSIGNSSENLKVCGIVRILELITVKKVKNIGGKPGFKDTVYKRAINTEIKENSVPELTMDSSVFNCETVKYDYKPEHDAFLDTLTDSDLATLVIGNYDGPEKHTTFLEKYGGEVPGAVGETTLRLKDKGLDESLIMSDGPAGLHIFMAYGKDEKGTFPLENYGGGFITLVKKYMPNEVIESMGIGKSYEERKKNCEEQFQYCTAIPIGTAIAQSFNPELAEGIGDIVGTEMEIFGVNLWLAPGMNLHRSPLCGRDFEYFSEDPLVIGKMAAAMTRGTQKHKGCGNTLKHFCCNNQETRRLYNSSNVSERALRELYVKGFEIAIRESEPIGIMSSYNLVNGIHSCERFDLMTDYLRCEAGFKGLIMTDWTTTNYDKGEGKYRNSCAAPTIKSGNDLYMPGSTQDYDDIMKALAEGTLTREELLRNAQSVYSTIRGINPERK